MELEDRLTLPSAEGIDLDLVLAGPGSRGVAQMVDLVIEVVLIFLLSLVASTFGDAGLAIAAAGGLLVLLGYPILFETFNGGKSVGKAMLGIAVVSIDGTPVRFLPSLVRNVVRVIDILPGMYTVGLISVLATSRNQRIGDLAANALVIRRPGKQSATPRIGWAVPAPPPPLRSAPGESATSGWDVSAVTAEEVAAIREFLGRRGELAPVARGQISEALANQVLPKVAGVPLDGGAEAFLERIAQAKFDR